MLLFTSLFLQLLVHFQESSSMLKYWFVVSDIAEPRGTIGSSSDLRLHTLRVNTVTRTFSRAVNWERPFVETCVFSSKNQTHRRNLLNVLRIFCLSHIILFFFEKVAHDKVAAVQKSKDWLINQFHHESIAVGNCHSDSLNWWVFFSFQIWKNRQITFKRKLPKYTGCIARAIS